MIRNNVNNPQWNLFMLGIQRFDNLNQIWFVFIYWLQFSRLFRLLNVIASTWQCLSVGISTVLSVFCGEPILLHILILRNGQKRLGLKGIGSWPVTRSIDVQRCRDGGQYLATGTGHWARPVPSKRTLFRPCQCESTPPPPTLSLNECIQSAAVPHSFIIAVICRFYLLI